MIPLDISETIFIADVHLGKLARLLRLFGFDTEYKNYLTSSDLLKIAVEENRILLTRNAAFKENQHLSFIHISNEYPEEQLKEVILKSNLQGRFQPFTRCIICNGSLEVAVKESILNLVKENTVLFYNEFWQCNNCKRVYWKGSHYQKMLHLIEKYQFS